MHKIWLTIKSVIWLIVIVASLLVITSTTNIFGFQTFIVRSGSMEPAIKTGSVIVDRSSGEYKNGDIVTYKNPDNEQETVTHRVIEVKTDETGTTNYVLKGDANDGPDPTKITKDMIVGKTIFTLPYIGFFYSFLKTLPGLLVFIVLPAMIIIYDEIDTIKKESAKIAKKRKDKKTQKAEKPDNEGTAVEIKPRVVKKVKLDTVGTKTKRKEDK